MNIIEAIKRRKSVRIYTGRRLSASETAAIEKAIIDAVIPFNPCKITVKMARFDDNSTFKPTTYGVIKGARDFLLMGFDDSDISALSAGFKFEQIVLAATTLGLGTCWMAATFDGTKFAKSIQLPQGESLKIVSPIGEPANRKRLIDRLTRAIARSDKRKPFDSMFVMGENKSEVPKDNIFRPALDMMRLAPSSVNSQPWRAVVNDRSVDFYCQYKKWLSYVDMGIGLCHFDLAMKYYNHTGKWHQIASNKINLKPGTRYVISFILE